MLFNPKDHVEDIMHSYGGDIEAFKHDNCQVCECGCDGVYLACEETTHWDEAERRKGGWVVDGHESRRFDVSEARMMRDYGTHFHGIGI